MYCYQNTYNREASIVQIGNENFPDDFPISPMKLGNE